MNNVTPFPSRRTTSPNVSAVAFVLDGLLLPELIDTRPRLGEPLADYRARRDAGLDMVDELLHDYLRALEADGFEPLGGAA